MRQLRICKHQCLAFLVLLLILTGFAAPDCAFATPEHPVVVSLGDSYSSGEGVEPFYGQDGERDNANNLDWLAHRSQLSWPGKLRIRAANGEYVTLSEVKDGGEYADWYFRASSGAETRHIKIYTDEDDGNRNNWGQQEKHVVYKKNASFSVMGPLVDHTYWIPNQLDVFKEIDQGTVDYVTVSVGGNDAGFVDILISAVIKSWEAIDPTKMDAVFEQLWIDYEDHIEDNIRQTYRDIHSAAGDQATIIVVGYPKLIDEADHIDVGLNVHEAETINKNVSKFNQKLSAIVEDLRENEGISIYFVSVEERFAGHEAYSDDPYINEITIGSKSQDLNQTYSNVASAYSIHPNEKGTAAYARAVQQTIDQLEDEKAGIAYSAPTESGATDGKTRDIALVLDVSGSMNGDPMDEVKRATVRFGNTVLGTTAKVGVIAFDSKADVVEPLTDNNERVAIAADELGGGGGTNMGAGLTEAANMLSKSTADRKIVILMTDGEPNEGMSEDELIAYADKLKDQGYLIYTLGFFSGMQPGSKSAPQMLLEKIASEGCHYEVTDASDLQFFFGDIADQINGVRYNYIRIACPVDVTVSYGGETLSSGDTSGRARTTFGTLTFEDAAVADNGNSSESGADAVKILRLREGPEYEVSINGTGTGAMDYTIGFVDDDGEYSDMRYFDAISVGPKTQISTLAKVADTTRMTIDYDGDGEIDKTYEAKASSHAEIVDNSQVVSLVTMAASVLGLLIAALFVWSLIRIWKPKQSRQQTN